MEITETQMDICSESSAYLYPHSSPFVYICLYFVERANVVKESFSNSYLFVY